MKDQFVQSVKGLRNTPKVTSAAASQTKLPEPAQDVESYIAASDLSQFSEKIRRLIRLGHEYSFLSDRPFKHAALIFSQHLIALETNRKKTGHIPPGYPPWTFTPHAELNALFRAGNKAKGATLISLRRFYRNARPCKGCILAIKNAGIKKIIYCTGNGWKIEKI